jgi:hypothetical protein
VTPSWRAAAASESSISATREIAEVTAHTFEAVWTVEEVRG